MFAFGAFQNRDRVLGEDLGRIFYMGASRAAVRISMHCIAFLTSEDGGLRLLPCTVSSLNKMLHNRVAEELTFTERP